MRPCRYEIVQADALEFLQAQGTNSVDLVFTSPPYSKARTYGIGADRTTADWVEWMRTIVREACRVSKGLAVFNVSDVVEGGVYGGGPEYLFADATRIDGLQGIRPYVWVKSGPGFDDRGNGLPGSGGVDFHRNDYEPVYGFVEPGKLPLPYAYPIAFGLLPSHAPGGKMRHRDRYGKRKGIRIAHTRRPDGQLKQNPEYKPPLLSNAGNVIRVRVGGHRLGHKKAHDNEAPMPLGLAERFVCWFCPPGGKVLDPFVGMGTTAHAAVLHGREFLGCDLRGSQVVGAKERAANAVPDLFSTLEVNDEHERLSA